MGYIARFRHGDRTLNLIDPYFLTDNFVPPPANEEPVFSDAPGVNRLGGNDLNDVMAANFTWSFDLDIGGDGDTVGSIRKNFDDLLDFLRLAGDPAKPLYFDWLPHANITTPPTYGQWNNWRSLEVIWGGGKLSEDYASQRFIWLPNCSLTLTVKPYPLGAEHLVGTAIGLVYSDVYPADSKGFSRGVVIGAGAINIATNPSVETNTTNWATSGADTAISRTIIEKLYGRYSLEIISQSSSADRGAVYSQAVTAGQTYTISISHYMLNGSWKLKIGGNVSGILVDDLKLSATKWGRIAATVTAGASDTSLNIYIVTDTAAPGKCFVDGLLVLNSNFNRSYFDGSFRACTWSGTAHASTSSSTGGDIYFTLTDLIDPSQSTIAIQWTPLFSSASLPSGQTLYLFKTDTISFYLRWNSTSNTWTFYDGTNTTTSAATAFTAGTAIDIRIVLASNTAKIFINGVQSGNTGSYKPVTSGSYLFHIGNDGSANRICGTFNGLQIYPYGLADAQNAADYANLAPILAEGRRTDWLTFLWGSSVEVTNTVLVYNSNHSSTITNFAVVGEVPGSLQAITRFTLEGSYQLQTGAKGGFFLSRMLVPAGMLLSRFLGFYGELQGAADANSSGGAYESKAAVGTTAVTFTKQIEMGLDQIDVLSGQEIAMLCRIRDVAAANLQIQFYYQFGGDAAYYSGWKTIGSADIFLSRLTKFLGFKDIRRSIEGVTLSLPATSGFYIQVKRSASSGDVYGDYYQIVTKPTLRVFSTASTGTPRRIYYDSKQHDVIAEDNTGVLTTDLAYVEGSDPFELMPDFDNYIIHGAGDISRQCAQVLYNDSITFFSMKVQPRWRIAG